MRKINDCKYMEVNEDKLRHKYVTFEDIFCDIM